MTSLSSPLNFPISSPQHSYGYSRSACCLIPVKFSSLIWIIFRFVYFVCFVVIFHLVTTPSSLCDATPPSKGGSLKNPVTTVPGSDSVVPLPSFTMQLPTNSLDSP